MESGATSLSPDPSPAKPATAAVAAAVKVKEEPQDEIKDYAETTMNELLGWYGLEKSVDSHDTRNLDLNRFAPMAEALQRSAGSRSASSLSSSPTSSVSSSSTSSRPGVSSPVGGLALTAATSAAAAAAAVAASLVTATTVPVKATAVPVRATPVSAISTTAAPGSATVVTTVSTPLAPVGSGTHDLVVNQPERNCASVDSLDLHQNIHEGTARLGEVLDKASPLLQPRKDSQGQTDRSLEGQDVACGAATEAPPGESAVRQSQPIVCAWCQKPGFKLFTLKMSSSSTKAFCSELCFTLCRRASFKKNKVCDWCKEVGNTVNYVDLQDGDQQLQFCTEKCLNQYKMNIFCKETQEHLQQIQAGVNVDAGVVPPVSSANQILITPELWVQHRRSTLQGLVGGPDTQTSREVTPHSAKAGRDEKRAARRDSIRDRFIARGGGSSNSEAAACKREAGLSEGSKGMVPPRHGGAHIDKIISSLGIDKMSGRTQSDGHRTRRVQSRESLSSTPLSIMTSPPSQGSTPHSYGNSGGVGAAHTVGSSAALGTAETAAAAAAAMAGAVPFLAGAGPTSHPLMYHPLLAAGLSSMSSLPGAAATGLPPVGGLTNRFHGNRAQSSSTQSNSSTTSPLAGPSLPPPPAPPQHVNPSAGLLGSFLPGAGAYMPFHPLAAAYQNSLLPQLGGPLGGLMPPNTLIVPCPIPIPFPFPVPIPIPIPMPWKGGVVEEKAHNLGPALGVTVKQEKLSPCQDGDSVGGEERVTQSAGLPNLSSRFSTRTPPPPPPPPAMADCSGLLSQHSAQIPCSCCQSDEGTGARPRSEEPKKRSLSDGDTADLAHSAPLSNHFSSCGVDDVQNDVMDLSTDSSRSRAFRESSRSSPSMSTDINRNGGVYGMTPPPPPSAHLGGYEDREVDPTDGLPTLAESSYSSRRKRILDAPTIPNEPKCTTSPDGRLYLRDPYRDRDQLYSKRRCIRARIKSK